MKFACAAKNLCLGKHIPVGTRTKCKECKLYMHDFCTGLAVQPPLSKFDSLGGYTCALCSNTIVRRFMNSPEGRALHASKKSQMSQSPLLPLPFQNTCTPVETPAGVTRLGKIPVYHDLGKIS